MSPTPVTSVERAPGQEMDLDYTKQKSILNNNFFRTRLWSPEMVYDTTEGNIKLNFYSRTKNALRVHKNIQHPKE